MQWVDISEDPNSPEVLRARQAELDDAWAPQTPDRTRFILDRCDGKRVLDIGCVEHNVAAAANPEWLHGLVREAAKECIGVDIHGAGIAALRTRGFDVVEHDITTGPGPLTDRGRFETIVCGEIIEHLRDPLALLESAAELLTEAGELVLTTPNPYTPHRVHGGYRKIQWESVDHLTYLFPSGMAELAGRAGLKLTHASTTPLSSRRTMLFLALGLRRPLTALCAALGPLGRAPKRRLAALADNRRISMPVLASYWRHWNTGFVGETAMYVLSPAD